jgi:hypothetical protein
MNRSHKRAKAGPSERPITFRAAEDLGAFELAQLWADRTAWPLTFDRWHEWAWRQRDFIVNGKPGITEEEYEAVARLFAAVGIEL